MGEPDVNVLHVVVLVDRIEERLDLRYDRPWGPERPIFGKVRYMTSDTPEKLRRYCEYIERYSERDD